MEPFDAEQTIREACNILSPQAKTLNLSITYTPESQSDPYQKVPLLLGDKRRLRQVMVNLIKNALKYTKKGKIEVTSRYERDKTSGAAGAFQVSVKDTGAGIAAQDMTKLFNRFGKLQRTSKINNDGIGLGLTIVQ